MPFDDLRYLVRHGRWLQRCGTLASLISRVIATTDDHPAAPIAGPIDSDAQAAAMRFADCVRVAAGETRMQRLVALCARLALRAFAGESEAWALLVAAIRRLLAGARGGGVDGNRSRRDLRAFVRENADLIEL